ncbi:MAG: cell division protein FtsQ/DivIB [Parvularcula sp.]|nr:cell division protein FtsQ/DivIB [Parvularcula sp.]
MPKVAKKTPAKKTPARGRTTRVQRRKMGLMESLGAKLDEQAPLAAARAINLGYVALVAVAAGSILFAVFGGKLSSLPERLAALPENTARGLGLNVMRVTVKGAETLTTRDIMQALRDDQAGSIIGRPLPLLNPSSLRARVEEIGAVEHASVTKLLPNTIHISVIERSVRALYQDEAGTFFVIDKEGAIIRQVDATDHTDLPVVSGTKKPELAMTFLATLRDFPVLYERMAGVVVVGERRMDLRFKNGFLAKLPQEDVAAALARLDSLDAGTGSLASNLDYIDLRDPDFAYYKPKADAKPAP